MINPVLRNAMLGFAPGIALCLLSPSAHAQGLDRPTASIEASTDHRRRGLSWSDGDPAIDVYASVPIGGGFSASGRATTLRGSDRHAGADAAFDLTAGWRRDSGAFQLRADATAHLFAGGSGDLDYVELGGGAGTLIGPLQVELLASYAPDQAAIGGENLYVGARGILGVPATPFTVIAHVGHSSGSTDDPLRAARLRPGGDYLDWGLAVERSTGPLTLGLRYTGTDVDTRVPLPPLAEAGDSGDRLTGFVSLSF